MTIFIYLISILWMLSSVFMILVILLQRGRGGGLVGALGGVGGSSAFGARAGDTFTWITVGAFLFWLLLALVLVQMMAVKAPSQGLPEFVAQPPVESALPTPSPVNPGDLGGGITPIPPPVDDKKPEATPAAEPKSEEKSAEAPKTEAPKTDEKKPEATPEGEKKADEKPAEAPKAEAKPEEPKAEEKKPEAAPETEKKADEKPADAPKAEEPKSDAPKTEGSTP